MVTKPLHVRKDGSAQKGQGNNEALRKVIAGQFTDY